MSDRTTNMRGNPLSLVGPELKLGDPAPDFKLHQRGPDGLKDVTLDDFAGKTLVLSVVPSLDTPVCELQTKRACPVRGPRLGRGGDYAPARRGNPDSEHGLAVRS